MISQILRSGGCQRRLSGGRMDRARPNPSFRPRIIDDELSAQLCSGRQLLLHSQSRRSKFTAPDRSYRSSANGFSKRTRPAGIHDRCHRHTAGPSSCDLVFAGRRCRFRDEMEARQSHVFACLADARADFGKPIAKGRARHMATALLGAQPCAMSAISHDTSITFISIP
jgi:hypothetical protein